MVWAFWPHRISKKNLIFLRTLCKISHISMHRVFVCPGPACTDTSEVLRQTKETAWPSFRRPTAASVCLCVFVVQPHAAFAEHMMTGISSCSGLDVIPNTGLKNASGNNTRFTKWTSGRLPASHGQAAAAWTSLDSQTCPQICLRPQAGLGFYGQNYIFLFLYCRPNRKRMGNMCWRSGWIKIMKVF